MAQTNFTPILTYKSDTASAVPSAGNLTNSANGAELAVNTADKRLFTKDSGGNVVEIGTNPSSLTLPNGTANGIVYANGSKVLTTGSALTFDGAAFVVGAASNTSRGGGFSSALFYRASGTQYIDVQTGSGGTGGILFSAAATGAYGAVQYDSTAANMQFYTSGSEQMRLTSTGLGIGTSSPGSRLNVVGGSVTLSGTASFNSEIFQEASAKRGLIFGYETASQVGIIAGHTNGNPSNLAFWTFSGSAWGERMRIDSSGNLGLGVTPSAGVRLQLADGQIIGSAGNYIALSANGGYSSGSWRYVSSTSAARYDQDAGVHKWFTAPSGTAGNAISFTQSMTLDASGNLGIGTSSPASKLTVYGGEVQWGASSSLGFLGYTGGFPLIGSLGALPLAFYTNGSEKMRLDSSGNLGLGVTPSAWGANITALDMPSGASFFSGAYLASLGTIVGNNVYNNVGNKYKANGYATQYVMLGTDGSHRWYTAPSGTAGDAISFSQVMTLDSSGNLGIGTSSPGAKLEVVGTKSGTGAESFNLLRLNLSGTRAIGDSANITWFSGGNTIAAINGISGADNIAYGTLTFSTRNYNTDTLVEALRIDNRGNLGLGVTPSAWGSGWKASQIGDFGGAVSYSGGAVQFGLNTYHNGTNWLYTATSTATLYQQVSGTHKWFTAPSGTAGNAISFTQAMTLTAGGNQLVGTTTDNGNRLAVSGGTNGMVTDFINTNASGSYITITQSGVQNWAIGQPAGVDALVFTSGRNTIASGTERARITSGGDLLVGTTSNPLGARLFGDGGTSTNAVGAYSQGSGGNVAFYGRVDSTSNYLALWSYSGSAVGSITTNGSLTLYNTTSDQRLKENIQESDSASSLIDSLQVRKFDWKANGSHQRYGFVAQELLTVAPEAVYQPEDAEAMMAVDYSKLVPMLVKEIQSLRTRVAALESI